MIFYIHAECILIYLSANLWGFATSANWFFRAEKVENGHFWHFCIWHPIFNVQYGNLKMLQLPRDFLEISGIGPRLFFMFCFKHAIHSYWMSQAQTSNFRFFEAFFQISTPIWEPYCALIATKIGMDKSQSINNLQ